MKWAHIFVEGDGTVEYSRAGQHYQVDFSQCRGVELTDSERFQTEEYIQEVYELDTTLNETELENNGQDMPEEIVEDFVNAITAVIDNGGIEKGSKPVDDFLLNTVILYDDNDNQIYSLEWYSVDEESDMDSVNEQFFDSFSDMMMEL